MTLSRIKGLFHACVLALVPVAGHALTEADCKEILVQYGVVASGCAPALGVSEPTVAPATITPVAVAPTVSVAPPADPITDRLRESHVFFVAGGVALPAEAQAQLQKLAKVLSIGPMDQACLKLIGHSDSLGSDAANLVLSQQRAQVVAEYLTQQLGDPARIEMVTGVGEAQPIPGLASTARENRRVEIQARQCPQYAVQSIVLKK